jgi:hypothetical protein
VLPLAFSLGQLADLAQVAAGLGVGLAIAQIFQGASNSRVAVVTGLTTLITEVDQVFIDRPGLWKYFNDCEPTPEPGDEDGERARAVAITMANVLDHIVEHRRKIKRETRKSWLRYIAEVYEKSPVFREVLADHSTWWPGLQGQIRKAAVTPCTPTGTPAERPAAASP